MINSTLLPQAKQENKEHSQVLVPSFLSEIKKTNNLNCNMFNQSNKTNSYFLMKDRIYSSNNNIYIGQLLNGKFHGYGKYFYSETREKYVGYWKNGKRDGLGEFQFHYGSVFRGNFLKDVPHGKGAVKGKLFSYFGKWENGKMVGKFQFLDHLLKKSIFKDVTLQAKTVIIDLSEVLQEENTYNLGLNKNILHTRIKKKKSISLKKLYSVKKSTNKFNIYSNLDFHKILNNSLEENIFKNNHKMDRLNSLSSQKTSYLDFGVSSPNINNFSINKKNKKKIESETKFNKKNVNIPIKYNNNLKNINKLFSNENIVHLKNFKLSKEKNKNNNNT